MGPKRVAINGFGRIGRMFVRSLLESGTYSDINIVAINDLNDHRTCMHLLRYDSVHGRFPTCLTSIDDSTMDFGTGPVRTLQCSQAQKLPWQEMNIDVVIECTGRMHHAEQVRQHLQAGARKVLVASPCEGADCAVVYGINHTSIRPEHQIVSNTSCTTNALAPIAHVLHNSFGIVNGFMTTIHAYTNDQCLVDSMHKDLRRARAAGISMIPSTTGAAQAVGLVLPDLQGRLHGTSIRVPTANVSALDLVVTTQQATTVESVNQAFSQTSQSGPLHGILHTTHEPLVSVDYNHTTASSTVDMQQTYVVRDHLVRVLSWYDNEWGFTNRLCDVTRLL